jgi:uncharacterized repeat protein (TIGR03833 family)
VPGALVNIVLKADQPTGRTVQGAVSQLLTRGNHPRGIKVRLTDGRVGRVQSMVAGSAPASERIQRQPDAVSEMTFGERQADAAFGGRGPHHGGRSRRDEEQLPSPQPIGLDAYIKPAKKRGKGKNVGNTAADAADGSMADAQRTEQEESTCPVCGSFRGDVAALTHHVQSHFDD